jgi:aminoglycoside phosphotransferase (APT) family kinase protein
VDQDAAAALVRHALDSHALQGRVPRARDDDRRLVPLESGGDHFAFDVDGRFIARLRKHRDEHAAAAIEREVELLQLVARISPIAVPEVVAAVPQHGLIVLTRLPGTSLLHDPPRDPMLLVEPLAALLAALHAVPTREVEHLVERDEYPLDAWLADAAADMAQVAAHVPANQRRAVDAFLAAPPPCASGVRTFCHNDLGAEHLLAAADGSTLTGIIDWSDAAIADPARDVGLLLRDLGPPVATAILRAIAARSRAHGGAGAHHDLVSTLADDGLFARALFFARCALLEDLAYGIRTSRPRYAEHALSRLGSIFRDR